MSTITHTDSITTEHSPSNHTPTGNNHNGSFDAAAPPARRRTTSRRLVAMVVVAACLALAGSATTSGRADAAGAGTGVACFQVQYHGTWMAWANYPVHVEVWHQGRAYRMATVTTNYRGCVSVPALLAGYYWRFRVHHAPINAAIGSSYGTYFGQTAWRYVTGAYLYDFGTAAVDFRPNM